MHSKQSVDSYRKFTTGTSYAYPLALGWAVNIHDGFYLQTSNETRVTDLEWSFDQAHSRTGEIVITILKTPQRNTGKFLKKVIAAAALSACSVAQAGVLNFEQDVDSPFLFAGDHVRMGEFWIETYGGVYDYDLVGAIVDGSSGDCMTGGCPVNNASKYYASLDDSYFYFGMNDDAHFKVNSLQASFMGAGQGSFPAVSGILVLQGFDQFGVGVGGAVQIGLAGPNTKGDFNFASYNLGAFSNNSLSYVRVLGYACDATSGICNRSSNLANFAIDNITTTTVPEPTSIALLGLGVAGLAFARRRRAA